MTEPAFDCICGDAFSDKYDYPNEVHYFTCPTRVRQNGHRAGDHCIPVYKDFFLQLIDRLHELDGGVHDSMGRPYGKCSKDCIAEHYEIVDP